MKKIFRKKIVWFFVIGLVLGVGVWKIAPLLGKKSDSTDGKPVTHTVRKETLKETVTISGELGAEEKTSVRFQSSGLLAWVGVKKNDFVKKGTALASLDKAELQKNLTKYLNTYMDSRWDFEQTKDEYREPAQDYWNMSWDQRRELDRALQKAQFDLNNAVLDVELKDILLRYATIYAPIDGIITSIAAPYSGIHVTPATSEIEIVNPASIYFSLLPDQNEVTNLSASMSADIIFDSYDTETVTGTIRDIAFTPKTGESSTVYEVKIQFPVTDPSHTKYRLGMTGDATFLLKERTDILAIPPAFIKNEKEKKYVTKQTGNKKEKVYIETGLEVDQWTEITGGLAEGDVIYD